MVVTRSTMELISSLTERRMAGPMTGKMASTTGWGSVSTEVRTAAATGWASARGSESPRCERSATASARTSAT